MSGMMTAFGHGSYMAKPSQSRKGRTITPRLITTGSTTRLWYSRWTKTVTAPAESPLRCCRIPPRNLKQFGIRQVDVRKADVEIRFQLALGQSRNLVRYRLTGRHSLVGDFQQSVGTQESEIDPAGIY